MTASRHRKVPGSNLGGGIFFSLSPKTARYRNLYKEVPFPDTSKENFDNEPLKHATFSDFKPDDVFLRYYNHR